MNAPINTLIISLIIGVLGLLFLNLLRVLSRGAREGHLFGLFVRRNIGFLTILLMLGLFRLKMWVDGLPEGEVSLLLQVLRVLPMRWALTVTGMADALDVIIVSCAVLLAIKTVMIGIFDYILKRVREVDVPGLIRAPITWGAYLVAIGIIIRFLLQWDVTPLFTGTAIISLVLGFALQDTLSNLFTGLSIHFEKSVEIGHWVNIGQHEGRVVGVTWRAINVRTFNGDYVIIPNSTFGKMEITNYSLPTTVHAVSLLIGTSYADPPNKVRQAIFQSLEEVDGVLRRPEPVVYTHAYGDFSITYRIKFWINDYSRHHLIESDVYNNLWYVFRRRDITIPFPIRTVHLHHAKEATREDELAKSVEMLRCVDFLAPLAEADFRLLAEGTRAVIYAKGQEVVRQGEDGDEFYLALDGELEVTKSAPDEKAVVVGTLRSGDFFGEMAMLSGEKRTATVRALKDSTLAVVDREHFRRVLLAKPELAARISEVLAERVARGVEAMEKYREAVEKARGGAPSDEAKKIAARILGNIRKFLRL